jgi:HEAT repeat protein
MEIIMKNKVLLSIACTMLISVACRAAEQSVAELMAALKSADETTRLAAIDGLAQKGSKAVEAVSALTNLLKDASPTVRAHAVRALGEIGPASATSLDAVANLIGDQNESVRQMVIVAVHRINPDPKANISLFIKAMNSDKDPAVRIRAMQAFAAMGEPAVPFLVKSLKDKDATYWACLILNKIGPKAKEAVPALTETLGDERPEVRREAVLALAEIGKPAAAAIPGIVKILGNELDCKASLYALGRIAEPIGSDGEAKIKQLTGSKDKFISTIALWTLARLHPEDKQLASNAAASLFEGLKSNDENVRQISAKGLASLHLSQEVFLPVMEKALAGTDEKVVHGALDAIAGLGPAGVPKLIEALQYEKTRPYVVNILGKHGPVAKSAVAAIVKLLDDKNADVQHEALIAIAKIGPDAKAAVPALTAELVKDDPELLCGATYALGAIGPDAKSASTAIAKNLDNNDETLSLLSAWALANIQLSDAKTAEKIVPLLIHGLSDQDVRFRRGAAEALKKCGPSAKTALPALQKALDDEDSSVRKAAEEALKTIGGK